MKKFLVLALTLSVSKAEPTSVSFGFSLALNYNPTSTMVDTLRFHLEEGLGMVNPFGTGEINIAIKILEVSTRRRRRSATYEAQIKVDYIAPDSFIGEVDIWNLAGDILGSLKSSLADTLFVHQMALGAMSVDDFMIEVQDDEQIMETTTDNWETTIFAHYGDYSEITTHSFDLHTTAAPINEYYYEEDYYDDDHYEYHSRQRVNILFEPTLTIELSDSDINAITIELEKELTTLNPFEGGETQVGYYGWYEYEAYFKAPFEAHFIAPENFNGEPALENLASKVLAGIQTALESSSIVDQTALNQLNVDLFTNYGEVTGYEEMGQLPA